jgi:hypothetical protein
MVVVFLCYVPECGFVHKGGLNSAKSSMMNLVVDAILLYTIILSISLEEKHIFN